MVHAPAPSAARGLSASQCLAKFTEATCAQDAEQSQAWLSAYLEEHGAGGERIVRPVVLGVATAQLAA